MKVVIVNSSDLQGGAARAAYRLHQSLCASGIQSYMLVAQKKSNEDLILGPETRWKRFIFQIRPHIENILIKLYSQKTPTRFSPSLLPLSGIVKKINSLNPDIVHLHWICDAMIPISDLYKIKAPIIWTLHDMWAFTGGCHYSENCKGYYYGCIECKVLNNNKKTWLSKLIFKEKEKSFAKLSNMVIIGLSSWIREEAKQSLLLKDKQIVHIPNLIDCNIFQPLDKKIMRKLWKLPSEKKLILFGAVNATSDPRKGFNELKKAFQHIDKKNDIELVVMGSSKPLKSQNFGFKIYYVGDLADDASMVSLYNAVDVVVVPSLEENLSNVIMESLSCATPVVAFDIGGNKDMIEHKVNGYLATPYDSCDLAYGMQWVLYNNRYNNLSKEARSKILLNFSKEKVIKKYLKLYNEVVENAN